MGKIITPFDPVTMRWLNEASQDSTYQEQSNTFESGYEDPTYMTFRIEFGGWGATTIPSLDTFKLMQRINTISPDGLSKTAGTNFRYDDFPSGLLDLNFADISIKTYPGYSFNHQTSYNAYNYLLMRNEDTRAEYLKQFVEGLYDIQRKYPYVFQSISGLQTLSHVSPSRGIRLKDAQITIDCIEGLSQKITTLMELYRRAAWDQYYQRWILPENYRQFKMIIYIFERREFHSVSAMNIAQASAAENQNFGQKVLGFLSSAASYTGGYNRGSLNYSPDSQFLPPIRGQQPSYGPHPINSLLPVYAYECDMCEFDINDEVNDTVTANWDDTTPYSKKIKINIKNVRHYFKNGLTKQLKNTLIYDLVSAIERNGTASDSDQGANRWISKSRLYENEETPAIRPGFGGEGNSTSTSTTSSKKAWDDMINNWKRLFGKGVENPGNGFSSQKTASALMKADLIPRPEDLNQGNWWRSVSVTGSILNRKGSFWENIWKILSEGTKQVRANVGGSNDTNVSPTFSNTLQAVLYGSRGAESYFSYATQHFYKDNKKNNITDSARSMIDHDSTGRGKETHRGYNTHRTDYIDSTGAVNDSVDNITNPLEGYVDEERTILSATEKDEINAEINWDEEREIPEEMVGADDERYIYASEAVDNPYEFTEEEYKERRVTNKILDGRLNKKRVVRKTMNKVKMKARKLKKPKLPVISRKQRKINGSMPKYSEYTERELEKMSMENMQEDERELKRYNMELDEREERELPEFFNEEEFEEYEEREVPEYQIEEDEETEEDEDSGYIEDDSDDEASNIIQDDSDFTPRNEGINSTGIVCEGLEPARKIELMDITKEVLETRQLPPEVILDRTEFLDNLSKATSSKLANDFVEQDKLLVESERKLFNLLQDDEVGKAWETLGRMSATENKELYNDVQEFAQNADQIRGEYEKRIQALQDTLKQQSEKAIRALPQLQIVSSERSVRDLDKDLVMVPNEAIQRIADNHALYTMDTDTIRDLSFTNLMEVDRTLMRAIADTDAMVTVISTDVISKATSQGQLKDKSAGTIIETKKSSSGKELLG